jgi:hypothetical protein
MNDATGLVAMTLVGAGLALTAWAQLSPLRRGRDLLDRIAIVPEWRFYAQASVDSAADFARDVHLVARDRDASGRIGGWRAVLGHADRQLVHAVWHPAMRTDDLVLSLGEDLALGYARQPAPAVQQSLRYLVLLRRVLAEPADCAEAAERQFAVVYSRSRGERDLSIAFLSAWHPQ